MAKIVLDPGHGGTAKLGGSSPNNAIGPSGLLEKTVTLDVAFRAEKILASRGHTVILTRRADNNVGLADRAKAAKTIAAPVFVSIHLNGFNKTVQGTETICDTLHSSLSATLCRSVQKRVLAATGYADRNQGHPGGVKVQSLGVLKTNLHHPKTACCLVEISFMDVAAEEARLKKPGYLDQIATAIADGLTDYLAAGGLEAVEASGGFEDGFSASGGKAQRLPVTRTPAQGVKPKQSKAEAAAQNDAGEFATVAIGPGQEVPEVLEGAAGAGVESPGGTLADFRTFIQGLGLRHFVADEFLFMGASNAAGQSCAGLNHFPPEDLWPNIANTARMLDEIRHRLGAPCRILSAYRSPAYNTCIGGESASYHMRFNAIDFRCVTGTPAAWHAVAKAVRASNPAFVGGIGKYSTFVHVDTRGFQANW